MAQGRTNLLPECNGPKLHPFKNPESNVEFKDLISERIPTNSFGGQAHVFKVSINNETYALKIFRFFDEFEARESLHNRREKFTSALICGHMDPFFQECRAYGRLIEKNVNGKVAVRCHGYMMIPADRELELDQRFGATTWDRPEEDYSMPESKREPFRALVKDLVTEDPPLTSKIAKKMVFDLRKMRSYGILNMDIAARNYMSGLLIDFGFALTSPSLQFIIGMGRTEDMRDHDLIRFDGMLDEAGIVTLHRARSNPERVNSLRPRNNEGRDVKQPGPSRGILEGSKQA